MVVSGVIFGAFHWLNFLWLGTETTAGTVILAALPIVIGIQLLLAFIGYDISSVPNRPFHMNVRSTKGK